MAIVFIACHKNNDEVPQPDPNKPTPDKPIPDKPKPDNPKPNTPTNAYLYGITIDDSWDKTKVTVQQIVSAIKAMPVKPTVRIVMSKGTAIANYKPLFSAVHQVAYVMATPADSEDMKYYETVDSYVKRFQDSYKVLSAYTDFGDFGSGCFLRVVCHFHRVDQRSAGLFFNVGRASVPELHAEQGGI